MIKRGFFILIAIWFVMSLIRLGNNIVRIYSEEKKLLFFTQDQKKTLLFGDIHPSLSIIEKTTSKKSFIIVFLPFPASDPRIEYLSLYYLYPRRLKFLRSSIGEETLNNSRGYLAVYFPSRERQAGIIEEIRNKHLDIVSEYKGKDYSLLLYKL